LTRHSSVLLSLLAASLWCGCEPDTGGRLTTIDLSIESAPLTFTVDGHEVRLDEARLSFGPLYVFAQPPPQTSRWQRIEQLVWPTAHAHAGHDFFLRGEVVAEWLQPAVIDLTGGRQRLGAMSAIEGPARSFSLYLKSVKPLDSAGLRLAGAVRRQGALLPFSVTLAVDRDPTLQRVDFAPVDGVLAGGRTMVLRIQPAAWFRGARFEESPLTDLAPESQTARAIQLNIKRSSAWSALIE
jgi:hypothetical protein